MIALSDRRWPFAAVALLVVALAVAVLPTGCGRPDDPEFYVQQLASERDETRRRAIEELTRMQERAIPAIEEGLQSDDPRVRSACLQVLGRTRRISSLLTAGEMLDDPDEDVRLQAIETVAELSAVWTERSTELLGKALRQDNPEVIQRAAQGLRELHEAEAIEVLRQEYEQGDGLSAIYAARHLYEEEPAPEIARFLLESVRAGADDEIEAARSALKELQDRIVPELVEFAGRHGGRPEELLIETRDDLIAELNRILDARRAQDILAALGVIADEPSVEKLITDMQDTRLQSSWRVAAADALGTAAASDRSTRPLRRRITEALNQTMDRGREDNRVRIAAAISLCRLRQDSGVEYLLTQLDRFQDIVGGEQRLSGSELDALKELRIRAQEALTASGEFVVEPLRQRLTADEEPGPIIIWAAVKTFGELRVDDTVPLMRRFILDRREPTEQRPLIEVREDGQLSVEVVLPNWQEPDEQEVRALIDELEPFRYPEYVRWTVANALRQIGGQEAEDILAEAAGEKQDFVDRLRANQDLRDYHMRAPVIEGLIARHEDVLFYVRLAMEQLGMPLVAQTGS